MSSTITPFLMFEGRASEALALYTSLFPGTQVLHMDREDGEHGMIRAAVVELAGQRLRFYDSPAPHAFTFTPALSLFVDCADEAELRRLHAALAEGGQELMPVGNYGFSPLYTWINDRFGVSWQLNVPA
ncbi:VOC family protein [Deinococcus yunweiensis]|uniref:VOC family protein n=1 Tax=Deinococcus yunweiensis TaxID=367282 RepID=UPI00398EDC07